jgi:hypothetical protein
VGSAREIDSAESHFEPQGGRYVGVNASGLPSAQRKRGGGSSRIIGETIPSLRIASDDHRRGVLAKEQLDELKDTLSEFTAYVRELLDFRREQQDARAEAVPPERATNALVIAGRGIIDQTAAELVADAIRFDLGMSTQCPSLGGLTGISAAAAAVHDAAPDIVVLISAGEVSVAQLNLLLRRAKRVFDGAAIIVGYWGASEVPESLRHEVDENVIVAAAAESLVHTVGRIADERIPTPRRPPPLKVGVNA